MGIKLSQLAGDSAHVDVSFKLGTLSIDYAPLKITDEMLALFTDFANTNGSNANGRFAQVNRILAEIVMSWDLLEDDGETSIALTPERLANISPVIKLVIATAILSDIRPESIAPLVNQLN